MGQENWTLTALQRRRIEAAEMKLLRPLAGYTLYNHKTNDSMPRTTDCRHTRHDRWKETELAFTLAKNATKPNPFEIIPLQTTRKENNWKTEEVLAQAAVTLEMERIKVSNPWCLWWWFLCIGVILLLAYSPIHKYFQNPREWNVLHLLVDGFGVNFIHCHCINM